MAHVLGVLIGWAAALGALFWFTNRQRNPARTPASAFLLFLGVFGGIALAALSVTTFAAFALGLEHSSARALGPLIAVVAIIPGWRYALAKIRQPG